jgi:hypothetical protein
VCQLAKQQNQSYVPSLFFFPTLFTRSTAASSLKHPPDSSWKPNWNCQSRPTILYAEGRDSWRSGSDFAQGLHSIDSRNNNSAKVMSFTTPPPLVPSLFLLLVRAVKASSHHVTTVRSCDPSHPPCNKKAFFIYRNSIKKGTVLYLLVPNF